MFYQSSIWLEGKLVDIFPIYKSRTMAFMRAGTSETLLSQQWSTSDMVEGLTTILGDSLTKLPESLEELEASANYGQHTSVKSFWENQLYGP